MDDGPCRIDHAADLPAIEYAYLLGQYLGDGYISSAPGSRTWTLRIFSDVKYPGLIEECSLAMRAMFPSKRAWTFRAKEGQCVAIGMASMHWPCLFPQHGPGKKHLRKIALEDWQREVVEAHPGCLLRGLIHSDGCRIIARECKNGNVRHAPRYVFSNFSDDIKGIFCWACELLEIE